MGLQCQHCGSTNTVSRGKNILASGATKHRYSCNNCKKNFYINGVDKFNAPVRLTGKKFVITSAQNNCALNQDFYGSLLNYCEMHDAKLLVIPIKYQTHLFDDVNWEHDDIYTLTETVDLFDKLRVLGSIPFNPALVDPLAGIDPMSKGHSLIIGHPQLRMKALAVNSSGDPALLTTTGSITLPNYTQTKQGEKARFNHSFSAIVVESDNEVFHMRVLNADETGGFYDVDGYYSQYDYTPLDGVAAIVTGDEHAVFSSPEVAEATYLAKDSMVNVLKPEVIVRHDVLDCYAVSHHHKNNFFTRYAKHATGTDSIERELDITIDYIKRTTPKDVMNIIVSSNHNDHLVKWLNLADPKLEPHNAKIYHMLMWIMLDKMKTDKDGSFSYPDPFEEYCRITEPELLEENIEFIGRDISQKILDIEISNHGDLGVNGSRGSLQQYSRLSTKCIIGHSHTPGINQGAYQVGTSSKLRLEYNHGPSTWLNTHCIIYKNGKRQLINIIGGRWKA